MVTERRHVFLSYCHDNIGQVKRLRQALLDAGEQVWWDRDIRGGQDWHLAVRQAISECYAVVLCLSRESDARITSGIYPELSDAIRVFRQLKPGSVYIIPVRLSECPLPRVEISATQTLDALQYVDLFPDSRYEEGVLGLVESIRAAPLHP